MAGVVSLASLPVKDGLVDVFVAIMVGYIFNREA